MAKDKARPAKRLSPAQRRKQDQENHLAIIGREIMNPTPGMTAKEIRLNELNILSIWAKNIVSDSCRQLIAEYVIERVKELTEEAS